MMYLYLYPHIYVNKNNEGAVFIDTQRNNHIYLKNNQLNSISITNNCVVDAPDNIIKLLVEADMGYIVDSKISPVVLNSINYTSSKHKNRTALSYLDGANSLDIIEKISLYVDNTGFYHSDNHFFLAANFPSKSVPDISTYYNIFDSIHFPSLQEIEIISSLTERALSLSTYLKDTGAVISFRVFTYSIEEVQFALRLAREHIEWIFKIFVPVKLSKSINTRLPPNIRLTLYSTELSEIIANPELPIYPILFSKDSQADLLFEMKLSKDDILSSRTTISMIRQKSQFNTLYWGNILLIGNSCYTANQKICEIVNFKEGFNNWLYHPNNLWFLSRNKWLKCKNCLFSELCPSVSILELENIVDIPCHIHETNDA